MFRNRSQHWSGGLDIVRMLKPLITITFMLLTVLGSAPSALAQFDSATVLGTVRDNTGGVVPGATVTLTGLDTGITSTKVTDENGNFEFTTVRIGRYKITAELTGFSIALADNVQATVGARQRVDLQLAPGSMQETIEVVGASTRLETDSSERGQVITAQQVVALPLNGREYSSLALLSPGVRLSALNTGSASTVREGSFNINGLRSTFNNFLLDGIDNNAYGTSNQGFSNQVMQPSPDAVAEFRVVTNNMSAEYGRSAGGTINVSYRSGTNRFSGAAWEFFRDTDLNATGFFKPAAGKPTLSRDQFGGTFGGPIVKNRAFFFGDIEAFRQTRQNVSFQTIPTLVQRQGILAVAVRNPISGTIYPAGTPIPMTAFAQKVLSGLPDPTSAGTANNYSILQQFTNNTDKFNLKGDLQFTPSLNGFARYGYRDADIVDNPPVPLPSGGSGNGLTYVTNKQFVSGFTWTRSGTSLLEGRFGWSRTVAGKSPLSLGTPSALDAFGIAGLPTDDRITGGLPTQLISGFSDLGRQATNPQWQFPEVFNPKLNYTWVRGRHSLKTGYEFQHINTEVQDVNPLYGRDSYAGQISNPTPGIAPNSLYNLADFMFGFRSQYALSNILIANLRQQMHFTYLQDDFRVGNGLTLNLGMRYEYATPQWERDNILSNYDPVSNTIIPAKDGSLFERARIKPDRNNFGPRAGFAWTALPQTVVRGGYGLSYVHFHRAGGANILPINGPQVINAVVNQTNTLDAAFRPTEQGYPAGLTDPSRFNPLAANITYIPEDYHSSQVQSYFVSVQREIARNMLLDVAYVGNRADDLLLLANYNQASPNNSAGTIALANRRPIAGFADITYAFNGGKSRYNSLQVKYDYRPRRGLLLLNAFTWSQARDNGAGTLEAPNGNFPSPQDFRNLDADFGTSGYNQPLNNTTSVVWELPFGEGHRWLSDAGAITEALLGGWTLSGINTMTSGEAVNLTYVPTTSFIVSGIQQDFRGANNYRPNQNGSPYGDTSSVTSYLTRDNVTLPTDPSQPFGNAPRNSVRGPWFWQLDAVAAKHFRLPFGTDTRAEFRLEAFNLLNRANFRGPNGVRSANAFGTITSTYDARQLQLGVKVMF
ncbi:MAG: TonB-dependent receptor [Vicinamibacterales bacterium]